MTSASCKIEHPGVSPQTGGEKRVGGKGGRSPTVEARFQWGGMSLSSSDQVLLNHWFTMLAFRSENRFKNVPFLRVCCMSQPFSGKDP